MTATIDHLPVWKKNSTAEEWLLELAAMARKHPERYARAVIVIEETKSTGNTRQRCYSRNAPLAYRLGMLVIAQAEELAESRQLV